MGKMPSLIASVASLFLLFIMICNPGCFDMGWEQGGGGGCRGQLLYALIVTGVKSHIPSASIQLTVIYPIMVVLNPRFFHIDSPCHRPTMVGLACITPILRATLVTSGWTIVILLPIVPQGGDSVIPYKGIIRHARVLPLLHMPGSILYFFIVHLTSTSI